MHLWPLDTRSSLAKNCTGGGKDDVVNILLLLCEFAVDWEARSDI